MSRIPARDILWIVAALILLGLIAVELRRASAFQAEIQELKTTEPPLRFANAPLRVASDYISVIYSLDRKIDWKGLKSIGLTGDTPMTCTIFPDSARDAMQQLFGDQVEVLETPEGLIVRARAVETPP